MTFVDTNYFLRLLLQDNQEQFKSAKKLFLDAASGKIELVTSIVTFFEIAWVLKSVYGKDRAKIAETLRKVLELNVKLPERELLFATVELVKNTSLSLEDCYNLTFAKFQGAKQFASFDIKLAKKFLQYTR